MTLQAICLRLLTAMLVGALIGGERESAHRPAGLRTHMLVSIGAAVVMILGIIMSEKYPGADPSRMGAQVISGIGFLGAGTILREGLAIKGLTTAASLWAVACMGLAAGAGYYTVTLIGTLIIFLTLTVFERVQGWVVKPRFPHYLLEVESTEVAPILNLLDTYAKETEFHLCAFNIQKNENNFMISCQIKSDSPSNVFRQQTLLTRLSSEPCIRRLSINPL